MEQKPRKRPVFISEEFERINVERSLDSCIAAIRNNKGRPAWIRDTNLAKKMGRIFAFGRIDLETSSDEFYFFITHDSAREMLRYKDLSELYVQKR